MGLEWMRRARCQGLDVDVFFKADYERLAKWYCDHCPVKRECGDYADHMRINGYPVSGMWGGTDRSRKHRRVSNET